MQLSFIQTSEKQWDLNGGEGEDYKTEENSDAMLTDSNLIDSCYPLS